MAELKLAQIERIMRKAGAQRISAEAKEALREILEEVAYEIASLAVEIAQHSGRKGVQAEDIKLAAKQLLD
ncbi:MAG TPA: histone family protein [Euryarchaeota archaeon]|nr:histone family protein [Euryarchaeota archaeon]HIQ10127.1 histone family protein [Euryarchaeota archaeon]